jgi:hypothetical protein
MSIKTLKKVWYLVVLFFWMFSPVIKLGTLVDFKTHLIFILFPALIGIYKYFSVGQSSRLVNHVLVAMLLGFGYVLLYEFIGILQGVVDFNFTKEYIMGFLLLFSAFYIVGKYRIIYGRSYINVISKHLFFVGVAHSLLVLLVAVLPDFRELLYQYVNITQKQERYVFGDVLNRRYSGILQTGFSSLSVTHSILLSFGFYFMWKLRDNISVLWTAIYSFYSGIIFMSLIYIGRSGIVVVFLYLFMLLSLLSISLIKSGKISKFLIKFILFAGVFGLVLVWTIDYEFHSEAIDSSFEVFNRYIETGSFGSISTDQIIDHELIFPSSAVGLLIGTGIFGRGDYRIPSDVGFVYFVNGFGIVGMIIAFSFYFILIYYAYKLRGYDFLLFAMLSFLVLLLIPLNFKDLYFLGFSGFVKIFFIILSVYHFVYVDIFLNRDQFIVKSSVYSF